MYRKQDAPLSGPTEEETAAARADAQEKLMALRREFARQQGNDQPTAARHAAVVGTACSNPRTGTASGDHSAVAGQAEASSTATLLETIAALPPHLGWGNERLTEQLRRALARQQAIRPSEASPTPTAPSLNSDTNRPPQTANFPFTGRLPEPTALPDRKARDASVRLFPDIALAMMREKQTAAGRLWLLLRHLDSEGRGWLTIRHASRMLTADDSPLRICGRRQLSNLLAAGEGVFWERSAGDRKQEARIWLRATARVAAALGVARLAVSPVAVPVKELTGGIGTVRAHLFASFHSGRQGRHTSTGRPQARAPIARATLQSLSTASRNSQRAYERRARVQRRAAFAVGPAVGSADAHEVAWRRGRALFKFTDRDGRHGRPGRTYLAWQLPNEYAGPHTRLGRGRMKRINRALAGLLVNGMTGNGERQAFGPVGKRFCGNAKAAVAADRKRLAGQDLYWRAGDGRWQWWPELEQRTPVALPLAVRRQTDSEDRGKRKPASDTALPPSPQPPIPFFFPAMEKTCALDRDNVMI